MNWKPGDRAIICDIPPDMEYSEWNGRFVTVASKMMYDDYFKDYYVDTAPRPLGVDGIWVDCLRPIDDDYDGLEKTSWKECPWQPKILEVV